MKILHVAPVHARRISGPSASVVQLAAAQASLPGVGVSILSSSGDIGPIRARVPIAFLRPNPLAAFSRHRKLHGTPDVVVFHRTYIVAHIALAHVLKRMRIPYILAPRGGLTEASEVLSRWKKRIANAIFFRRFVRQTAALHFLTQEEAEASKRWSSGIPTFIVGNGTCIPPPDMLARPGMRSFIRIVFLGRLHVYPKGLDLLVQAAGRLRDFLATTSTILELWGPDHTGGERYLSDLLDRLCLGSSVQLRGSVQGAHKSRVFQSADVFVHTSRFEGHPLSVCEALAHGLPCLLTPGTNVASHVASEGAGWMVEANVDAISSGIKRILAERAKLAFMGRRARQLAEAHYRWEVVAAATLDHYRRALQKFHSRRLGIRTQPQQKLPPG